MEHSESLSTDVSFEISSDHLRSVTEHGPSVDLLAHSCQHPKGTNFFTDHTQGVGFLDSPLLCSNWVISNTELGTLAEIGEVSIKKLKPSQHVVHRSSSADDCFRPRQYHGRSPDLYAKLREEVLLLTPSVTIMSVGTEIRYEDSMEPDHGWEEELNQGWDREVAVEEGRNLNLKFQVRR